MKIIKTDCDLVCLLCTKPVSETDMIIIDAKTKQQLGGVHRDCYDNSDLGRMLREAARK